MGSGWEWTMGVGLGRRVAIGTPKLGSEPESCCRIGGRAWCCSESFRDGGLAGVFMSLTVASEDGLQGDVDDVDEADSIIADFPSTARSALAASDGPSNRSD